MKKLIAVFALALAVLAGAAAAETFTFTIPDVYLKEGGGEKVVLLDVNGTGRVKAVPDQVVISARIYTKSKNAGAAFDENQRKMRALMDRLAPVGIPREKVATESLSIGPVYKKNSSKVDYYAVTRQLKITQDDMAAISPVLDALVGADIGDIGDIQFVVKDLEQKYEEALAAAAADCRRTAELLASSLGAEIVGLKAMSYSYSGGPTDALSRAGLGGGAAARYEAFNQMIVPGEVTTAVTVRATYELVYPGGD